VTDTSEPHVPHELGGQMMGKSDPAGAPARPASTTCTATTLRGERCPVGPATGSTLCRMHLAKSDPAVAAQLALARKRGGDRTALRVQQAAEAPDLGDVDLSTAGGCRAVLTRVAKLVAAGRLSAASGNTIVAATRAAITAAEAEVHAALRQLQNEIARLEQQRGGGRR
jgi:hypothetical protein